MTHRLQWYFSRFACGEQVLTNKEITTCKGGRRQLCYCGFGGCVKEVRVERRTPKPGQEKVKI
ncbi:MAG: hypothetical protein ABSB91_05220 [Sedimentisphaerales bacterium]